LIPSAQIAHDRGVFVCTRRSLGGLLVLALLAGTSVSAQDVRARTRLKQPPGTTVTKSQAVDPTLTLTPTSIRPIQTWVRTAGVIDRAGKVVTADVSPPTANLIRVGQRVRAFPVDSRSSVYQARVTRVVPRVTGVTFETTLAASGREGSRQYLLEIVADRGEFLSIPNEAIIEDGQKRIVYVHQQADEYVPHEIHTGIQGELYTQVLDGIAEGDQVVTFGSFFIDAEHKLKIAGQDTIE
jgi:hypothetical protein